jgi:DNA invertase Pin-like site-specific DNA recombinase
MSKITADHLARSAYVYVRQSTPGQVHRNHESRRRQYGLAERAKQLGWSDVVVVDDDLAISGDGVKRPGFERLLLAICEGQAGTVLTIEASRLARNGRDWHTLLEFCGLVNCLIIDEDGVYDARLPNDRLLLGKKGTMSEMELSMFRQRVSEARMLKAKRGELFGTIASAIARLRMRTRSRRNRISAYNRPSRWCSRNLLSFRASGRFTVGCARRASRCQTPHTVHRVARWYGNCRSTMLSMA